MKFLTENIWVWAGTGLVLITLSGQTRRLGIIITISAITMHALATFTTKDNE